MLNICRKKIQIIFALISNKLHFKRANYFLQLSLALNLIGFKKLQSIFTTLKIQTDVSPTVRGVDQIMRMHFFASAHVVVNALAFKQDL